MTRRPDAAVDAQSNSPRPGKGGVVPPNDCHWKPGQSGNPKGRPKGAATSFEATFERELSRRVAGDPALDGNRRVSRRTRLARAMLEQAERGNARIAKVVLDRLWPAAVIGPDPASPVVIVFDDQDRRELEAAERGLASARRE